jgi:uncharacterized protein YeaO (DUF488 family)
MFNISLWNSEYYCALRCKIRVEKTMIVKDKKETLDKLCEKTKDKTLCFLYEAKNHVINQAAVLRDVLSIGG